MDTVYQIREIIVAFVKRYDTIINFILRFIAGMFIYNAIMSIGLYNPAFAAMANMGLLFSAFMGLLFAILPINANYLIMILVTAVQFSLYLEISIIVLLGLLLMFLFYGQFGKKENVLVIATLMGFYFDIPYIVPIIAGLYFGLTSIIPMSIGALIYSYSHLIFYLSTEHTAIGVDMNMITDMELEEIFGAFMQLYDSFALNSEPIQGWIFLTVAMFVVFMFVYIVSKIPINYGKEIAIVLATILNIFAFIFASTFTNFGASIGMIIGMSLFATGIMLLYNFFNFALDYRGAGRVEFSDEDYYYYVKYIPKVKTVPSNQAPQRRTRQRVQSRPQPNPEQFFEE